MITAWRRTQVSTDGERGFPQIQDADDRGFQSVREELGSTSLIMDWQSPRNKKWIRAIALILTITFINQDIVWAQGGTPAWSKGESGSFAVKQPPGVQGGIAIPKDVAVTKEVYTTAVGDKTIINI